MVLFHVAFGLPFAIFLLRNFFAGIPRELLEAARHGRRGRVADLPHASCCPLGCPAIASLGIFQFLWVWNDLLVGAGLRRHATPADHRCAAQRRLRQFGTNIDVLAPGAFLSMIVPLVVFFAFQRYFVQGVLAGSDR